MIIWENDTNEQRKDAEPTALAPDAERCIRSLMQSIFHVREYPAEAAAEPSLAGRSACRPAGFSRDGRRISHREPAGVR